MTDPKVAAAINRTIGRKLAKAMEARGYSRAAFAEKIGMTEARLARVLKGSSELTAPELIIAARALCVPVQSISF